VTLPHTSLRASPSLRHRSREEQRAGFFELFFDLVFVFAITQLSQVLYADLTLTGAGKTAFLLLVVWWAWIYTAWMTNWFDPESMLAARFVLLIGMLASLLMTVAIPDAFGDRAILFAVGYVALQLVRNTFIVVITDESEPLHRAFVHLWRWNSAVGLIWVIGSFLPHRGLVAVWIVALLLDYSGPVIGYGLRRTTRVSTLDWEIEHSHFAERFQLFVIVALGESIVVTGATAARQQLTPARTAAIVVAFLITAALWWLYFHRVAAFSRADFAAAGAARGRLGRDAYTYMHIPIVAGIVVAAVGNELVIAHPGDRIPTAELLALAAGPILYLLGHAGFQRVMTGRTWPARPVAAVLIAVGVLVGMTLPALATCTLILMILIGLAAAEARLGRSVIRPGHAP
jgi:low temperature requirement protein LtrA